MSVGLFPRKAYLQYGIQHCTYQRRKKPLMGYSFIWTDTLYCKLGGIVLYPVGRNLKLTEKCVCMK